MISPQPVMARTLTTLSRVQADTSMPYLSFHNIYQYLSTNYKLGLCMSLPEVSQFIHLVGKKADVYQLFHPKFSFPYICVLAESAKEQKEYPPLTLWAGL